MNNPPFKYLTAVQTGFCLLTGALSGLVWHAEAAYASSLGGMTVVLANTWYLWRLHSVALGGDSAIVLAAYQRAEVGKILVLVLLMATVLEISRRSFGTDVFFMRLLFGSFLLNCVFVTLSNTREIRRWLARLTE